MQNSSNSPGPLDDDVLWLLLAGVALVVFVVPLSAVVDSVRTALLEVGVLAGEDLIIDLGGAGLDWPRVLVLAGIVLLGLWLTVHSVRGRRGSEQGR